MWAVWMLIGAVVGSIVTSVVYFFRKGCGVLRIDHSNPEKDIYRFDVADIDALSKKRRIVLKVDNNACLYDDSQE